MRNDRYRGSIFDRFCNMTITASVGNFPDLMSVLCRYPAVVLLRHGMLTRKMTRPGMMVKAMVLFLGLLSERRKANDDQKDEDDAENNDEDGERTPERDSLAERTSAT